MISLDMIITQLEQQLTTAKNSQTEQQKRESLAAIRALCDVALQSPTQKTQVAEVYMEKPKYEQQTQIIQQSAPIISTPNQVNKLQEEDANGDSLFDF